MAAGLLLLLLVCAGGLLLPAEAQDSYDQLTTAAKAGVNFTLEQLKSHASVKHHLRFLKSVEIKQLDEGFGVLFLYHHFHLRPTRCDKGTAASSRNCQFRNDRPLMDCAVCYKTVNEQIEKTPEPYVHCIQRPRLTPEMVTTRLDRWKQMTYRTGSAIIMALSTG